MFYLLYICSLTMSISSLPGGRRGGERKGKGNLVASEDGIGSFFD